MPGSGLKIYKIIGDLATLNRHWPATQFARALTETQTFGGVVV